MDLSSLWNTIETVQTIAQEIETTPKEESAFEDRPDVLSSFLLHYVQGYCLFWIGCSCRNVPARGIELASLADVFLWNRAYLFMMIGAARIGVNAWEVGAIVIMPSFGR
jgi:hypothetical protein